MSLTIDPPLYYPLPMADLPKVMTFRVFDETAVLQVGELRTHEPLVWAVDEQNREPLNSATGEIVDGKMQISFEDAVSPHEPALVTVIG